MLPALDPGRLPLSSEQGGRHSATRPLRCSPLRHVQGPTAGGGLTGGWPLGATAAQRWQCLRHPQHKPLLGLRHPSRQRSRPRQAPLPFPQRPRVPARRVAPGPRRRRGRPQPCAPRPLFWCGRQSLLTPWPRPASSQRQPSPRPPALYRPLLALQPLLRRCRPARWPCSQRLPFPRPPLLRAHPPASRRPSRAPQCPHRHWPQRRPPRHCLHHLRLPLCSRTSLRPHHHSPRPGHPRGSSHRPHKGPHPRRRPGGSRSAARQPPRRPHGASPSAARPLRGPSPSRRRRAGRQRPRPAPGELLPAV